MRILICALILTGCASSSNQRAVFIQPLGQPSPPIIYSDLSPASINQSIRPMKTVSYAAVAESTLNTPTASGADTMLIPPSHNTSACAEPLVLRPGNLRYSLKLGLEACDVTLLHWLAGDQQHIFDFRLNDSVAIDLPGPDLLPVIEWLRIHYGLESQYDAARRIFNVNGISP